MADHPDRGNSSREVRDRYRMMIEEVKDYAIFMLDPKGYVASWNIGAKRIKGYTDDEIIGQHFSLFYTPEDAQNQKPAKLLAEALAKGRTEDEGWRVRKDKSRFWANAVITPLYDGDGTLQGFAKITRDMTDRREAEEILRRKNEELAQSRKIEAIGLLAGGIAHDFNNILTGILGCAEMLAMSLTAGSEQADEVSEIQKAASRAMALTKQLLAFSRRQTIQPKPTNLNTVVSGLSTMLRRLIREDITLTLTLDPVLDIIEADASQLEQVIVNLVVNARDAMPEGGTLLVETRNADVDAPMAGRLDISEGSYVMLSISDTGVGMTESVRAKIFEPFFTTKKEGFGTGLGLATVHGIVKQNHSAISIYTELGRGTTFKIWFPSLRAALATDASVVDMKFSGIPHGTEAILVVEDEAVVANYVARTLRALGYTVWVAIDAPQALV